MSKRQYAGGKTEVCEAARGGLAAVGMEDRDLLLELSTEDERLFEAAKDKSASWFFDAWVAELQRRIASSEPSPGADYERQTLLLVRIHRDLFRVEQRSLPGIFTKDSIEDVELWLECRQRLGWGANACDVTAGLDDEALGGGLIELRMQEAYRERDGNWFREFGELLSRGPDRPAIVNRASLVVLMLWEMQGDDAPPTKAALKRACLDRWPKAFPKMKSREWGKILKLAGVDWLEPGVRGKGKKGALS